MICSPSLFYFGVRLSLKHPLVKIYPTGTPRYQAMVIKSGSTSSITNLGDGQYTHC